MKTPDNFNLNNKTVLVRCDFNVSFDEKGNILDDLRIQESLETIKYLINQKSKIVLMTHFGKKRSSKEIIPKLEKMIGKNVTFINFSEGEIIKKGDLGEIYLLENLRLDEGEEDNDMKFAQKIASLGEFYINEAFSVCHRQHASIFWLPKLLPHCAGFRLAKEVKILNKVKKISWRPFVVIIGGAKVTSKVKSINSFLEKADEVLLGGKIANDVLTVKGLSPNRDWPDDDVVEAINKIDLTSPKLHLPIDLVISDMGCEECIHVVAPGTVKKNDDIFDIGPETIKFYNKIIKNAKMIVWAGPLSFFEDARFEKGTKEVGKAIANNHKAFKVAGGGDTCYALAKFKIRDEIDHVSTGGGAMLQFLSQDSLPGIKALEYED